MKKFISGGFVETYPKNENARSFHMRHELIKRNCYYTSDPVINKEDPFKDTLPCTEIVVRGLLNIKGTKEISIRQYEFTIHKAKAYSWSELDADIKLVMSKYLSATY